MPGKSSLLDVNALAIYLVEDHPGHPYVSEPIEEGLGGRSRLFAADQAPLRARWILTTRWGFPKGDAERAVRAFLDQPRVTYVGADRDALREAFSLAETLHHDVYDTYYLALARSHGIGGILTTDRDFKNLCAKVGLEYVNPVPPRVLEQFGGFRR